MMNGLITSDILVTFNDLGIVLCKIINIYVVVFLPSTSRSFYFGICNHIENQFKILL
jgi:hypothetical protein